MITLTPGYKFVFWILPLLFWLNDTCCKLDDKRKWLIKPFCWNKYFVLEFFIYLVITISKWSMFVFVINFVHAQSNHRFILPMIHQNSLNGNTIFFLYNFCFVIWQHSYCDMLKFWCPFDCSTCFQISTTFCTCHYNKALMTCTTFLHIYSL